MQERSNGWTDTKAIPVERDRRQSQWLVAVVGGTLVAAAVVPVCLTLEGADTYGRLALAISVLFAVTVLLLRAATPAASLLGGVICFLVTAKFGQQHALWHSGLPPLATLFLLTFAATRLARQVGVAIDPAERRRGRQASQVLANLGWAGLLVLVSPPPSQAYADPALTATLLVAVLAESTADTVASELGQAFGGQPRMLGSWRPVAPGTDGAITLGGTAAGAFAAALVLLSGMWALRLPAREALAAMAAALAGLFFDSLLGATLERRGWLGNDLVNFCSNGFAALCGAGLLLMLR